MSYLSDVKAAELSATKEYKLAKLTDKKVNLGYQPDTLSGLNDADSLITQNYGGTRSVAPDGSRYDAVELKHGNNPYNMYGISKESRDAGNIGKSMYSMQIQREQTARLVGKPVSEVTEQDMLDVGNMQQIQKLADLSRNANEPRWQAPLIHNVPQTNLTGEGYRDENGNLVDGTGKIPLDIPILDKTQGVLNNRYGLSVINPNTNINVTDSSAEDPFLNAFASRSNIAPDSTEFNPSSVSDAIQTTHPTNVVPDTLSKDIAGTVRAGVGGLVNVASGVLAAPKQLDDFTGKDFYDKNSEFSKEYPKYSKAIKSIVDTMYRGSKILDRVNDTYIDTDHRYRKKLSDDLNKSFSDGNYLNGAVDAIIDNPLGAIRYGVSSYGYSKALTSKGISKIPGLLSATTDNIDKATEEFREVNEREPNINEKGIIAILSMVNTAVDSKASSIVLHGVKGDKLLTGISKVFDKAVETLPIKTLQSIVKPVMYVSGRAIVEGVQEGPIQQGLQHIAANQNDLSKITDPEVLKDIYVNGIIGMVSPAGMKGSDIVVESAKNLTNIPKVINKNKDTIPKKTAVSKTQKQVLKDLDTLNMAAESKSDLPTLTKVLNKLSTYELDNEESKTKADIIRRKVADKLSTEDIAKVSDLDLGSEQEAEYFIEEMYQNATDKDSKRLLQNMATVGKQFGITLEDVKVIKDRAAVEKEATVSNKGYKTYDKDLIRLKKNPEANSKAIERVENTVLNFQATQEDRLDRIQKAVNNINDNLKAGTESRTKVVVPYAGGGNYTIHIKNGKINPATVGGVNSKGVKVPGVLADIQRTIDGIQTVIDKHGIAPMEEVSPYSTEGKFRVPNKMPYKQKGKGGTFEFVRNLKKQIASGNTVITPIFSKRTKKHVSTINKLKKEGYVEVDKNGYYKANTGIWVPKELGQVNEEADKVKLQKKEQTETKKEVNRLAKKVSTGTKLGPKEQEFVKQHKAEVAQVSNEMNVIKEIESIDTQLEAKEEKLKLLEEDTTEWYVTMGELDVLKADRKELLSNAEIQVILKNSSSTKTNTPKNQIGGVKFKQPVNINEYVEEKATPSLLGSVYVKYFENKIVKEAIESAKLLKKILAPVDYKDDPKMTKTKMQKEMLNTISSPARGLIFNTKGEVNENVAVAIEAALTEYIAMGSVNLGAKTEKDVARLLGLKPNEKPNSKQMNAFRNAGNYTKNVADDIGKAVISSLSLKRNKSIPQELYGKLIADLGNIAIELGREQGVLDTHSMQLAEHNKLTGKGTSEEVGVGTTVPFVRFTHQGKDMVDKYKLDHDRFKEALHLEDNFVKGPFSSARKTNDKKIRNNPITEQPEQGQNTLNTLREEKYIKQQSVIDFVTNPKNEEVVKFHMGYKSEEDMKKMSFYGRESQKAKNEEIERSIEFLKNAELDEMYFEWFYSRNGRYMMDSNTLNPQTDKLHRFAVVPENHKVDLDIGTADLDTNTDEQNEHRRLFLTALAQSLNLSTDKVSTEEVLAYGQSMLDRGSEALMEDLKSKKDKAEHISHYLQGVEAVRQFEQNDKSGKFTTHLSMESDAVTSGFGLKLLQLPILADKVSQEDGGMSTIDKTKEWLRKTGIFVNETVDSMNDMVSRKDFRDSYETLAAEVRPEEIKEDNYPEQGEGDKKWNPWKAVVKYDKYIKYNAFAKVLPTVNANGDVSKELRTLFKDPFMTFNYSRGISSIKNGLGYIIADGLIDSFVSGKMTSAEELLLADLKAVYGTDVVTKLQSVEPTKIKAKGSMDNDMPDIYTYLSKMGTNTYGHLAAKSLNENFKAFNEANEVINKAFSDMFLQYNEKYLIEREKLEEDIDKGGKGRGITKAEDDELIRSLRNTFPLIKGPYSKENYSDSIAIYDSENVSSKNLEKSYGTVSTKLADGKNKKVQSKIRQLKASLKGGSVIPIHYIDAAIMGNTIVDNKGTLGIHDAIIPNLLNTLKEVKDYNKNVIEVNKGYSVVGEVLDSYKRIIGDEATDAQKETLQKLQDLYDKAQANRDEIFNSQIDVVHMSAVPGSKYTHNKVQIKSKYTKAQINAVKGIILDKEGKIKPAIQKIAKEYNINLENC